MKEEKGNEGDRKLMKKKIETKNTLWKKKWKNGKEEEKRRNTKWMRKIIKKKWKHVDKTHWKKKSYDKK